MEKDRLIVLSGAGGKIGRALIRQILEKTSWRIIAFSSSIKEDCMMYERVTVHTNEEISTILPNLKDVDTCIHLAFSRRFNTNTEIALSLDFSSEFYKAASTCDSRLINISTVGVYGLNPDFPDEETKPAPDTLYAMAKYASEVLMNSYFQNSRIDYTNVRLSGIAQSQRVLPVFIDDAKNKGEIRITGGKQQFSWIDLDDAVNAIIALVAYDGRWRPIYNVTLNRQRYLITEIAEIVSSVAKEKGFNKTKITVIPTTDIPICVGWNSEAFSKDTGWTPTVAINETISKMF